MIRFRRAQPTIDVAVISIAFLSSVVIGLALGRGNLLLALLPAFAAVGLVLLAGLSLAGWCIAVLLTSVVARAAVTYLGAPSLIVFLHYPVTIAFALSASFTPRRDQGPSSNRWLIGLLVMVGVSSLVNLTNPLRAGLFLMIVGEPLLVIWAIQRWGPDEASERRVASVAFWLLAAQIPLGLWQGMRGGWFDTVSGTLAGQSAGAHLLGGLFAVGMFAWIAAVIDGRHSWWTVIPVCAVAFGMMGAGGAMQVILASAVALPFVVLLSPRRRREIHQRLQRRSRAGGTVRRVILASILVVFAVSAPVWANFLVEGIMARAADAVKTGPEDEIALVGQRERTNLVRFVFGSGPATTASRAALVLSPSYSKGGSILLELPLKPTALTTTLAKATSYANHHLYAGSADNPLSSMLGILGDLGIAGFIGLLVLFVSIYRVSARTGSWLTPAVGAALIMTWILCFIDNWIEYPEFVVPLAVLIGFATSHYRRSDGQSRRSEERPDSSLAHSGRA